jgi:hypothetical protein
MKLEQHFYTSGKPEFMTVAITEGINREERIQLENHSIYFLPVSLHYQEDITTPVKYMFYPLGEERFVVGRAIYKGKDSLGRTGNYLFHNLILSQNDLMDHCSLNPANLIKALNRAGVFRDDAPPEEAIDQIEFSPEAVVAPSSGLTEVPQDLLTRILSVCIHHDIVHQPLLLVGSEDECLDFLEHLYLTLPYDIRLTLGADTYAYGVSLGFQIIGSLADDEFRQGLISSLTLHLDTLESTVYNELPEPSKHLSFISGMASEDRIAELNAVFSLEYCLRQDNYVQFKQEYRNMAPELQRVVWEFHDDAILNHITAEQDTELLLLSQDYLIVANIDTLYLAPEMINHLIETDSQKNLELVAEWLCTEGSKVLFFPYLFRSPALWNVLIERIQQHPHDAVYLLEPVKAFQAQYSQEFEDVLLENMLLLLPVIKEDRKLAKDFFKAFETFPDVQDVAHLHLLRMFVKYELHKENDLLEQLIERDLSVLTASQQALVFDSILDRVLVVRSLKIWNPEKAEQHVRKLLENAANNTPTLLTLLEEMAKLQISKDSHKIVEKVFAEIRETLQQGKDAQQIETMIDRILQPPASLLEQLASKLLRMGKLDL